MSLLAVGYELYCSTRDLDIYSTCIRRRQYCAGFIGKVLKN